VLDNTNIEAKIIYRHIKDYLYYILVPSSIYPYASWTIRIIMHGWMRIRSSHGVTDRYLDRHCHDKHMAVDFPWPQNGGLLLQAVQVPVATRAHASFWSRSWVEVDNKCSSVGIAMRRESVRLRVARPQRQLDMFIMVTATLKEMLMLDGHD
jgi:hypothetical protein